MPPRTRKTAAPAPSLEDAAATTEQAAATDAPAETEPETTEPAATPSPDAEPEAASTGADDEAAAPEPESPDGDNQAEQPAPVEVQTFHWESVKNDGTEPCRLCTPGGPPPGVGSYGCGHGQWVRVQDAV